MGLRRNILLEKIPESETNKTSHSLKNKQTNKLLTVIIITRTPKSTDNKLIKICFALPKVR